MLFLAADFSSKKCDFPDVDIMKKIILNTFELFHSGNWANTMFW